MSRSESPLARWSRRKLAARAGVPEPEACEPEAPQAGAGEAGAADGPDATVAAELEENRRAAEAVDLDSLGADSDYTVFLKPGVPPALRQRALRRMFRSHPIISQRDGLDECYDIEKPFGVGPIRSTLWQLGRGFSDLVEDAPEDEPAPCEEAAATEGEAEDKEGEQEAGEEGDRAPARVAASPAAAGVPDASPTVSPAPSSSLDPAPAETPSERPMRARLRHRLGLDGGAA